MARFLVAALLASLGTGCTHMQLKRSTIGQARTLEDIYEQQVLDNLAKFVQNSGALPHFGFPKEGAATVTDSANSAPTIGFDTGGFASAGLAPGGSRQIQQSWTMDPIRDPHKLALMRCAYQKAVAGVSGGAVSTQCPNCEDRLREFYDGHGHAGDKDACLDGGGCWFRFGTKKDLPKDCSCTPVGHYCGVYVWVPPEGREQLTRLTLTILDFALYEPQGESVALKDVTVYLDAKNQPATAATAAQVIQATVRADEDLTQAHLKLLSPPDPKNPNGPPLMKMRAVPLPRVKSFGSDSPGLLDLRNRLRTIPR